ncbi:type II toxin-antitoxin system RelE/ParE family toxin [Ruminococcus sp. Marseille-P6503]|uniref:type II toxin-antitoxin system RelE/ParE family toxin n=1 Tax=Ruminococcus sp. Marseille-P6503 TaxID=2364796 RepID=UPI000F536CC4|nr:type II toxin-antitoxin system RelE/ParE family toxin [Ruminococcus sp. Marseille-P6503]
MISNYEVVISDEAQKDIDCLFEYICNALTAEKAAKRIVQQISRSILGLSSFPQKGVETRIKAYDGSNYRKLIVDKYIVFYLVYDEMKTVKIVRVIDGRTNYNM